MKTSEELRQMAEKVLPQTGFVSDEVLERHRERWMQAVKYLGPKWRALPNETTHH